MRRCLELARNGEGYAAPNPIVGCVIVHNDRIIGEGYHQRYGEAHAEVNAIDSVTDKSLLRESTLYVSLEPCCHWGKTPPCADLIIRMGIPRVVIGMIDPFSQVCGGGIQKLLQADISVTVGVLEKECRELNRRFITYNTKKRPYIILKWAQTADGYLDNNRDANTSPSWMTGPVCKTLVHRMRSRVSAIMAGTNTIERDNPSLTVRESGGKNPLRIVVDRTLRLSPKSHVFNSDAATLLFTDAALVGKAKNRHPEHEVVGLDPAADPITQVLNTLYERKVQSLFVEGGRQLLDSLIAAGLWDEMCVFVSPMHLSDLAGGRECEPRGVPAPEIDGVEHDREQIDGVTLIHTRNGA